MADLLLAVCACVRFRKQQLFILTTMIVHKKQEKPVKIEIPLANGSSEICARTKRSTGAKVHRIIQQTQRRPQSANGVIETQIL